MRIAIVGAGGVGAYFGARLQAAGNNVAYLARGAQLAALRGSGLRLTGRSGDLHLPQVEASDDPRALAPADAVLVTVKTWQLAEIAPRLAPLVGSETVIVPLLNGVEAADELAAALGPAPVAAGLCGIVSFLVAPGHVHHEGVDPYVRMGELDDRPSPRLERLVAALAGAGARAEVASDIYAALWQKLLFIAPVSAVAALVRTTLGQWRALAGPRDLATRAMHEVVAVATARGVRLPDGAVERTLAGLDAIEPTSTPSLQRDFEAGRRSELDAQAGAVVRLGADAGVPTPACQRLYECLLPQELAARAAASRRV